MPVTVRDVPGFGGASTGRRSSRALINYRGPAVLRTARVGRMPATRSTTCSTPRSRSRRREARHRSLGIPRHDRFCRHHGHRARRRIRHAVRRRRQDARHPDARRRHRRHPLGTVHASGRLGGADRRGAGGRPRGRHRRRVRQRAVDRGRRARHGGGFGLLSLSLFRSGVFLNVSQPSWPSPCRSSAAWPISTFRRGTREAAREGALRPVRAARRVSSAHVEPGAGAAGGTRREMTVLFADIRGFTTASEKGTPEGIVAMLNEYFSRMVEVILRQSRHDRQIRRRPW